MDQIFELDLTEIEAVAAGTVAPINTAFAWVGIASSIEWLGEKAYEAGVWVGSH